MATNIWTGAAGDDLWIANNWSLGHAPRDDDSVVIGSSGSHPTVAFEYGEGSTFSGLLDDFGAVELNGASVTAGSMTIESGGSLDDSAYPGWPGELIVSGASGIVNRGSVTVSGSVLDDKGAFINASSFFAQASTVEIGGALANSGLFVIGNFGLTTAATVDAASFDNTGGTLNLGYASGPSELDVTSGVAGFGTDGELIGTINLIGNGVISFDGGGQITDIVGFLWLDGSEASLEDAGGAANSALLGLTRIEGTLDISGDTLTTTSVGLTVDGALDVDTGYDSGDGQWGGADLDIHGTLTDNGTVALGALGLTGGTKVTLGGLKINAAASVTTFTFAGLVVNGELDVVSGATLTDGDAVVANGGGVIAGTVNGLGKLVFGGGETTIASAATISIARWTIEGGATTIGEALNFAGAFVMNSDATLTISSGYFDLEGAATIDGATIDGANKFIIRGDASVGSLTIGGEVLWEVENTVTQSGGNVTVGDGVGDVATLIIATGGIYDITDDSGIGSGTSTASEVIDEYEFEKTGGTGTSIISASFTSFNAVTAATGTLEFAGSSNSISGLLTGAGTIAFVGGLTVLKSDVRANVANLSFTGAGASVALIHSLDYGGNFTLGAGTNFNIQAGGELSLSGMASIGGDLGGQALFVTGGTTTLEDGGGLFTKTWLIANAATDVQVDESFTYAGLLVLDDGGTLTTGASADDVFALTNTATLSNATIDGGERFATRDLASVSSLTIGGATLWEDEGTVTQSGGDTRFIDVARLLITSGAVYDIADDSGLATSTATLATNRGLWEKTGGAGVSKIAPSVANSGTIEAASGTLALTGAVSGTGADMISGAATLEFDAAASLTQTIDFTGAGGTLFIASPSLFSSSTTASASISGYDTVGSNDTIEVGGPWTYVGFTENGAGTQGALTFADGANQASFTLLGDYSANHFHPMVSGGATYVTYG